MVEKIAGVNDVSRRPRRWQTLWIVLVIGTGLLWRSPVLSLPLPVAKYGGSALWALLVFLLFGWIFPRVATVRLAFLAIAFACAVEFSQLYHAAWIDQIRRTRLGALTLGAVFNWPDMIAYSLGVLAGAVAESTTGLRLGLAHGKRASKAR